MIFYFCKNKKIFTELDKRIRKRSKHLTEPEILANMYEEELKLLPLLEKEGRIILPDGERKKHSQFIGHRLERASEPNSSIDHVKIDQNTGKVIRIRRRFFDSNGNVEQDFDYQHQDSSENHLFPHIHIWIGKDRSLQILYR